MLAFESPALTEQQFHLPCNCGAEAQITSRSAGEKVLCPTCHDVIVVPSLSELNRRPATTATISISKKQLQVSLAELLALLTFCRLVAAFGASLGPQGVILVCDVAVVHLFLADWGNVRKLGTVRLPKVGPSLFLAFFLGCFGLHCLFPLTSVSHR